MLNIMLRRALFSEPTQPLQEIGARPLRWGDAGRGLAAWWLYARGPIQQDETLESFWPLQHGMHGGDRAAGEPAENAAFDFELVHYGEQVVNERLRRYLVNANAGLARTSVVVDNRSPVLAHRSQCRNPVLEVSDPAAMGEKRSRAGRKVKRED